MKKSKYCCHPPFHPSTFCHHSSKLLSPTLPKLMIWILLSPPPLSSDPDNPPKFGTCTNINEFILKLTAYADDVTAYADDAYYFIKIFNCYKVYSRYFWFLKNFPL